MYFRDVIGQAAVKNRLIQAVHDQRIPHAQLYLGPEGSGNLTLALAYAQYLCCENRGENDACGTCISCIKYEKLAHPDLHFVFPVNTTKSVSKHPTSAKFLAEWREALTQNSYINLHQWLEHIGIENKQGIINTDESGEIMRALSLKAYEAPYKVMVIWRPEKMNLAAANKLLKILEEPPEKTVFLLIAEDHEQIIPTILSRTQLVKVPRLPASELSEALVERWGQSPAAAASTAHMADGNYLEATRLLQDSEEEHFNRDMFIGWMRLCYSKNVLKAQDWTDQMSTIGRERQKNFLHYGLHLLRECLMVNYGTDALVRLEGPERDFVQKFSPFVHEGNSLQLIQGLEEAHYHIERNANPRILFLDLSLQTIKRLRIKRAVVEG